MKKKSIDATLMQLSTQKYLKQNDFSLFMTRKIKRIRFEPFEIMAREQEFKNEILTLTLEEIAEVKRRRRNRK